MEIKAMWEGSQVYRRELIKVGRSIVIGLYIALVQPDMTTTRASRRPPCRNCLCRNCPRSAKAVTWIDDGVP